MEVSYFFTSFEIDRVASSVVQMNPTEVFWLIFVDQVLGELIFLEENGGVVVKIQVEKRNIVSIFVVL